MDKPKQKKKENVKNEDPECVSLCGHEVGPSLEKQQGFLNHVTHAHAKRKFIKLCQRLNHTNSAQGSSATPP